MDISLPEPAEVFRKWVEEIDEKTFLSFFKVGKLKPFRHEIKPEDNIREVQKHIVATILVKFGVEAKEDIKFATALKLTRIIFYDYEVPESVPIFRSIEKLVCDVCKGSGRIACPTCNGSGSVVCKTCNGSGRLKCERCNGTGKVKIQLTVKKGELKQVAYFIEVICPECGGKGWLTCRDCYGTGRIRCPDCGGRGSYVCEHCEGFGYIFRYKVGPIGKPEKVELEVVACESLERKVIEAITEMKDSLPAVKVKSLEELELIAKELLPDDEVRSFLKSLKKVIKKLKKKNGKISAIAVYPILFVRVKSKKGKEAKLYAVGTAEMFKVLWVR